MSQLGAVLKQLKQERERLAIEMQQIDEAISSLSRVSGTGRKLRAGSSRVKRTMSAASRRRIVAAQKARWAKFHAAKRKVA